VFGRKRRKRCSRRPHERARSPPRAPSELTSQNTLIEAEQNYHLASTASDLPRAPDDRPIEVAPEEPTFVPVNWTRSAVRVAKKQPPRLPEPHGAARRRRARVRIAKNGLLPDLSLWLGYTRLGRADSSFLQQDLSGRLLQRVPDPGRADRPAAAARRVPFRADLACAAERSFSEFQDDLEVDVQSTFRELAARASRASTSRRTHLRPERNVKIAQLRFEQGTSRTATWSRPSSRLLDAQNALIDGEVAYEIARLGLLKDLGMLFIDEKGMWTE
jgi:hypothetical protein